MRGDCYFLGEKGCRMLTETVCDTKPCSFFLTSQEYHERKIKTRKRLVTIGRPDLLRKRKDDEDDDS